VSRPSDHGFSLIELLLSTAILSLLIGLATFSFALFSEKWVTIGNSSTQGLSELRRISLLDDSLRAVIPWKFGDDVSSGYYFLGDAEGFTAMTERPIFFRNGLAVIRVLAERESTGGRWRLVYEEASASELVAIRPDTNLPFNRRLVISSGLRDLYFEYLGWNSLADRYIPAEIGNTVEPAWISNFDGIARQHHPVAIRLNVDSNAIVISQADRVEEWQSIEVLE
jgi:prepilin-type N-terminal cleavage/methylation domain-containing protein